MKHDHNFPLVEGPEPRGDGRQTLRTLSPQIRRTIAIGCVVVLMAVVGLGLWAALAQVSGAVVASGVVKVENNRKSVRHLEPGTVKRILVRDGDPVRSGQLLMVFDDAEPRAQRDVLQASYDSLLGEQARYEAELARSATVTFPSELLARRADPAVAAIIAGEEGLFNARRNLLGSQVAVGAKRVQELGKQIAGTRAQVAASDRQITLNADELSGIKSLFDSGYAPKTRLLALQRSDAALNGSRGEQVADIARAEQSIGEARVQTLSAVQTRITEAASGLQQTRDKIADVLPRLAAARAGLMHTEVRAPAAGAVLNLTQFTEGSAINAGEPLFDIVPRDASLVVQLTIRPQDMHAVHAGMSAQISLQGYNSRTTPRLQATVTRVGADQITDPHTGKGFFTAELTISPAQRRRLPGDVKIRPGMPVTANLVTRDRSVLDYLLGPLGDMFGRSMHEA